MTASIRTLSRSHSRPNTRAAVLSMLVWALLSAVPSSAQSPLISSYVLEPDGNQVVLNDGDQIVFSQTLAGETATAAITIFNPSSTALSVRAVALEGNGFRLSGLPLMPSVIEPNSFVRFSVRFSPENSGQFEGLLTLTIPGSLRRVSLAGQGVNPAFEYQYSTGGQTVSLVPNSIAVLPETGIGEQQQLTIRVTNSGSASGRIQSISVSGPGFSVSGLPPLPVDLAVGQSLLFNLVVAPAEVGTLVGQLRIGQDLFEIHSVAVGAIVSLRLGSGTAVAPGGTIAFRNTVVGAEDIQFLQITNTGNVAASIGSLSLLGSSAFKLAGTPPLPASLAAGASLQFQIVFEPSSVETITGVLQIDQRQYPLTGVGERPPDIPAAIFEGVSGTVSPMEQPSLRFKIAEPYPVELRGEMVLEFTSGSFVDDPSIQFDSGGRTVQFRIPAQQTQALFGQASAAEVKFQAGTVAGTITISSTLTVNGVDVTPDDLEPLSLVVPATAPVIRSVSLGEKTATTFELLVTGYSTPRQMQNLQFTFIAVPGKTLRNQSATLDAAASFGAWYQGTASQQFGSQFTASIRFNVDGEILDVGSVEVIATNSSGTSEKTSVQVR